jgi:large subunit ribosomal protein L33
VVSSQKETSYWLLATEFWLLVFGVIMAKENREMVWLQCTETGDLNYRTEIKVAGGVQKVELKKFSPRLRKHTLHKVKRK